VRVRPEKDRMANTERAKGILQLRILEGSRKSDQPGGGRNQEGRASLCRHNRREQIQEHLSRMVCRPATSEVGKKEVLAWGSKGKWLDAFQNGAGLADLSKGQSKGEAGGGGKASEQLFSHKDSRDFGPLGSFFRESGVYGSKSL